MPGSIYVCIEVLLGGFAGANAIARVVVGKDVAVDSSPEADVEATHLAKVDSVAMGEEHCKSKRDDTCSFSGPTVAGEDICLNANLI